MQVKGNDIEKVSEKSSILKLPEVYHEKSHDVFRKRKKEKK